MKTDAVVVIGPGKENCDDSVLMNDYIFNNESGSITEDIRAVFVADGVGGNAGGKDAGMFVLNRIRNTDFSQSDEEAIRNRFMAINDELIQQASSLSGREKMATTLTGILKGKDGFYMVHVGNTRMYFKQGSYLKQISADQTQYQSLVDMGRYAEAEMCNRSVITGCFGAANRNLLSLLVVARIEQVRLPDLIVLTSDGIHDTLTVDELEENIILSPGLESAEKLIDISAAKSSQDDKSVVIINNK